MRRWQHSLIILSLLCHWTRRAWRRRGESGNHGKPLRGLQMATVPTGSIEDIAVNTIRTLCIDAVQQANSGQPGTPMAMAPVVYTLWQDYLRFDPEDPIWPNRDRFILSA